MQGIEVVRAGTLRAGSSTSGILREKAFDSGSAVFSKSTVAAGAVSNWHHHGARELYGYVVSGKLVLEHGKAGSEILEVRPGDFFHISPGLVHRDVNPGGGEPAVIVNLLLGEGEPVVNVDSPPT